MGGQQVDRRSAGVDYAAVFELFPTPCVILDPSLVILDCNDAYLTVTGRCREGLLGRGLFEAFPQTDPSKETGTAVRRVLMQALRTRRAAVLGAQRYDISPTGDPADTQVRFWTTTAVPLRGADGDVAALLYNIHDVTVLAQSAADAARLGHPRVRDLLRAAVEVTEQAPLFDDAVLAERQLGLAVQDAMLPAQIPPALRDRVAVRYRPASDVLHVGGDWYDVTHLDDDRFAVAVGDVVGHGLTAAVLMGQLRAALNALTLAELDPARALEGLDRFARQDSDAVVSTAMKLTIDPQEMTLTYSSAGHPPALLLSHDGTAQLLDQAHGPALALPTDTGPRPTATTAYRPGDRLVLYTDGLVERPGQDFDACLRHLADQLRRSCHLSVEELADRLLDERASGQADDIALLVVQL